MHSSLDINRSIRTYCQGPSDPTGPDSGMRAMQKTLPSPSLESADCNCLALRQAARHVTQTYDAYLASVGLKATQYSILAKLNRLGPLSINELAKLMVMDRTTLVRAVRPLERDRLLAIGGDDDARRPGAAEGRNSKVARGAEGVRIGVRRARLGKPAHRAAARGVHNLDGL